MKVTDDMGRLIPAKVQEAVEKLSSQESGDEIAELKELLHSIERSLYGSVEKLEKRVEKVEDRLLKPTSKPAKKSVKPVKE